MNYQEHKKKLFSSLSFARKWLSAGEDQKAIDFFAEWWYEYEMAKCVSSAPGDCYMSSDDFDEFLDGFNGLCKEDLRITVYNRVTKLRIKNKSGWTVKFKKIEEDSESFQSSDDKQENLF